MPERARADVVADPGAARDFADDTPGAVPVQPPPVVGEEDGAVAAFPGGQVDRPGGAGRERYGDDLAALIADSHMLADMVRTDSHQLRPAAGDSPEAAAVKVVARTHKTLIWERTRAVQRLRHQLREYFPAALGAFEDLDAPDTLELLGKTPDPARAAKLTRAQIAAALKRARRRGIAEKTDAILAALRGEHLGLPAPLTAAYAATARSLIAVITTLNEQVKILEEQVRGSAGNRQGPVPALQAQVLDVSAGGLRYPEPVQREQGDQRMIGRRPEPAVTSRAPSSLRSRAVA